MHLGIIYVDGHVRIKSTPPEWHKTRFLDAYWYHYKENRHVRIKSAPPEWFAIFELIGLFLQLLPAFIAQVVAFLVDVLNIGTGTHNAGGIVAMN